jgi:uncharacterized protein YjdB
MRSALGLLITLALFLTSFVPARAAWLPNGVPIGNAVGDQRSPAMVSLGGGGFIVAWSDGRNVSSGVVYAQRIDLTGTSQWTANGVALSTEIFGYQSGAVIASDGVGGAIVAWSDYRNANFDIYAQRVNAAGVPQWTADGVALSTAAQYQATPTIVSDGAGGAIVVWEDNRSGNSDAPDIYAQRVNASGIPQWTADGVAVCAAAVYQYEPKAVSDGAGGAIITWQDWQNGSPDIFAQRVNAAGTPQWTADGVALCTAANEGNVQSSPVITSDAVGGAIVAWSDSRSGGYDLYAQRVNAAGIPQWTADGVAVCTHTSNQATSAIVSDGAQGAVVAWVDSRSGPAVYDIYAARVTAAGTVQWTPDGVALCTAAFDQIEPAVSTDGAGGAIVTWKDNRTGLGYDVYARRVDALGVPHWTPDGVAMCTVDREQAGPTIISDGVGGAFVAWNDFRSGTNYDVYAQRVLDGVIPTGVGDTPSASVVALASNYPNPFSAGTTIDLSLSSDAMVEIEVFEVTGRIVRTLELGRVSAGSKPMGFDGRDDRGRLLASGVYFYRVRANGTAVTRKMVITR